VTVLLSDEYLIHLQMLCSTTEKLLMQTEQFCVKQHKKNLRGLFHNVQN